MLLLFYFNQTIRVSKLVLNICKLKSCQYGQLQFNRNNYYLNLTPDIMCVFIFLQSLEPGIILGSAELTLISRKNPRLNEQLSWLLLPKAFPEVMIISPLRKNIELIYWEINLVIFHCLFGENWWKAKERYKPRWGSLVSSSPSPIKHHH